MTAWQIEPLGPWNRPITSPRANAARFKASWAGTFELLISEINHLKPTDTIVVRVDVERGDLRLDGMLRANARVGFPGVVVSFTSRHLGPLAYATDAYERMYGGGLQSWQANLRAIALSLQALRAVDRYGVTKSGEQYVGWRAIEATPAAPFTNADSAERWLRTKFPTRSAAEPVRDLVRAARSAWHPDRTGGDRSDWDLLEQAIELMRAGGLL